MWRSEKTGSLSSWLLIAWVLEFGHRTLHWDEDAHHHAQHTWVLEIWMQDLTLTWQALYLLRHPPPLFPLPTSSFMEFVDLCRIYGLQSLNDGVTSGQGVTGRLMSFFEQHRMYLLDVDSCWSKMWWTLHTWGCCCHSIACCFTVYLLLIEMQSKRMIKIWLSLKVSLNGGKEKCYLKQELAKCITNIKHVPQPVCVHQPVCVSISLCVYTSLCVHNFDCISWGESKSPCYVLSRPIMSGSLVLEPQRVSQVFGICISYFCITMTKMPGRPKWLNYLSQGKILNSQFPRVLSYGGRTCSNSSRL